MREPLRWDRPSPGSDGEPRAVYVHAPFCARRCFYCDFAVQVRRNAEHGPWIRAVEGELAAVEREGFLSPGGSLETLYVGGGTPSLLGAGAMEALAEVLGRDRLTAPELEWTAEANPESFTEEVARGWRDAGVNRVSLGVQSFQETTLRWMGRLHGDRGASEAVERARRSGFSSFSIDLIFGLPERLERDWPGDLDAVADLGVPHVSLYGLTAEPATPLGRAVGEGRERLAGEEAYREAYLMAARRLTDAGYRHYEVSNFALPGHESRHNRAYWEGRPYLGLGNSAHSYRHPRRRWNLRDWDAYTEAAERGDLPVETEERLAPDSARLERVWLGLRTRTGLDLDSLPGPARKLVESWVGRGLAETGEGAVRLTPEGWLLLDRLSVEMDDRLPVPGRRYPPSPDGATPST